jgi:hypothetical protein
VRSGSLIGLFVVVGLGATAGASPLADALARHADADITALRAQRGDAAARCTLGAIYARRNDLPRAALYLADCDHLALPDDVAATVLRIIRAVKRRLDAGRYASLDVMTDPEGLTAELDTLPGESFTTPATIWVEPGAHQLHVTAAERSWTQRVTAEPHKAVAIMIETRLGVKPPAPRPTVIDIADDPGGAPGEQHTGPPPDRKHPSLISDKYRGVPEPTSEGPIEDPLAARAAPAAEHELWIGARLGAGMFDDGSAAARAGLAIAVAGRYRLTDAVFAAGRADWSRRGGEVLAGTVDVLGASAGVGMTVLGRSRLPASASASAPASASASASASGALPASRHAGIALALIGQLRTELRLTAMRDAAPVRRAGLGVAAGAELALPATPFTAGLRFEQGLTELVAGSRDRAVLVEVGIDLP